jgi:cytochrome c556
MHISRWLIAAGVGAAIMSTATTSAIAQTPAEIVKQRQDLMDGWYPKFYKSFAEIARGQSTDIAAVPAKAKEAATLVRTIPSLFPPGTGQDVVPTTRAKPEIWSNRTQFDANVAALATETEKLGDIAKSGDIEAYKTQYAAVGKACTSCHGGPSKSGGPFRMEGN